MNHTGGTHGDDHLDEATLNDVADHRLSGEHGARVQAHLESCGACRDRLEGLRQVIALGSTGEAKAATALLTAEPPPELWTIVAATTVHERIVRRHVLRAMRGTLGLAALVLVVISSSATVAVMQFTQHGLDSRANGSPAPPTSTFGGRGQAAEDVRRATLRQLAALANAEAAELSAIEPSGRRAEVERQLATLDSVLAVARDAVLASPLDHGLLGAVNDVYDRRRAVIRGVVDPR